MKKTMMALGMLVSAAAFAQSATVKPAPVAPVTEPTVACSADTKQAGGRNSQFEAVFCVKRGSMREPVLHGPYLGVYASGAKRVTGQYVDGQKTGLWTSFDEAGNKLEELTFVNTQWHGLRTLWVNGQKTVEENWVNGKQDGVQKYWDAAGKLTQQAFRAGVQVSQR